MDYEFRLTITGRIPDDNKDLGPEAQVSTKAPAHVIVEDLHKLGLLDVRQERVIVRKKPVASGPAYPKAGESA